MAKRQPKVNPTWEEVKAELASFDRAALLAVVQHLYAASEGNRSFLHARFGLGPDPLQPYKKIIDRWLWPDVFRGEETSVLRAKRAISNYKKASVIRRNWRSCWFTTASRPLDFVETWTIKIPRTVMRWCVCLSRRSEPQPVSQPTPEPSATVFSAHWTMCEVLVVSSDMGSAITWMFCLPSSYRLGGGVLHGDR